MEIRSRSSQRAGRTSSINEIVFTFYDQTGTTPTPLHLPENDDVGCTVTWQATILAPDDGVTPTQIEQVVDTMRPLRPSLTPSALTEGLRGRPFRIHRLMSCL